MDVEQKYENRNSKLLNQKFEPSSQERMAVILEIIRKKITPLLAKGETITATITPRKSSENRDTGCDGKLEVVNKKWYISITTGDSIVSNCMLFFCSGNKKNGCNYVSNMKMEIDLKNEILVLKTLIKKMS